MSIEENIIQEVRNSLNQSIVKTLGEGYNNPMSKLIEGVFESERAVTTKVVKEIFTEVIGSDEFKAQIKIEFQRKVAKNLVGQMEGQVKSAVQMLKQDPTFKSRMILAIEQIVETELSSQSK